MGTDIVDRCVVIRNLIEFFSDRIPSGRPFVFGCSGGVDSSALLSMIVEAGIKGCHVVHVDHGWRSESATEARLLRDRVEKMGLPFVCIRLEAPPERVNLEDWSRKKRFMAFRSVAEQVGAEHIVLAHQADDQVEVVLKRFFEGASITKFRGMRSVEDREGTRVLRPLLSVRRSDLLEYLNATQFPYVVDPTNSDPSYLRARMRMSMIPDLERTFGKAFHNSLLRVSDESAELDRFVQGECHRRFCLSTFPGGVVASSNEESVEPYLVRILVEQLREQLSLPSPSRSVVNGIVESFCGKRDGARTFLLGDGFFLAERGSLVAFQKRPMPIEVCTCDGKRGSCVTNGWSVSWTSAIAEPQEPVPWISLFAKKAVSWYIPAEPFRVCPISDRRLRTAPTSVSTTAPTALRPYIPALEQGFVLVVDPLSGYTVPVESGSPCCKVTVQRIFE